MIKFKEYLNKHGYHMNTQRSYTNIVNHFHNWCNDNEVNPKLATLDNLYDYQDWCRNKGDQTGTIRGRRLALKHYYKSSGRKVNPAMLLECKKRETTLPKNTLDDDTLTHIFASYVPQTLKQKRNKVIVGVLIFQGVNRCDLSLLQVEHVDLTNRVLYIPSTRRSNSRKVKLNPFQFHELQTYLYEIRPQLLIEARKETSQLFFSIGNGTGLNNSLSILLKEIKISNPYVNTLMQLRMSRITLWLNEFGLRKTQYFSGMKYPTSLERYETVNTDNLKRKLEKIHPMDRLGI